ncbi:hypothetical protein JOC70_002406 [Clostridium pascui]|uniref:hypothetical protein n=1 Tax=Clostridium pascui TaxID=46609 RepID=UPI00195C0517|nr:hypothetical protein [Clostridium pascui]MBM7870912.1 hypothetical protein [Clostridium pascui]
MDYIQYILNFLAILFIYIVITKVYMTVANYVGKHLGFGKLFMLLLERLKKQGVIHKKHKGG